MNKRGVAMQILFMLILVVITSLIVFTLVKAGVIEIEEVEEVPVLDTEFIPYTREGYLVIKEFKFCGYVDESYKCIDEKDSFNVGEDVHFRFVIESSTVEGDVLLVENYQLKGPSGEVLLEVDERYNRYLESESEKATDRVYFKDFLVGEEGDAPGEYTLELLVENPLLNKKVTLIKKFEAK